MANQSRSITHIQVALEQTRPTKRNDIREALNRQEMLTVLSQRKPMPFQTVPPKPYAEMDSHLRKQYEMHNHHHFERLNIQQSVWAESNNDGVALSASAMAG
ncbi:MAG TPA: hypothetical protein EYO33_03725 [Phycisphaerales bacterium]|nr:hypothetical protein [Phycisphaerales bacterium]